MIDKLLQENLGKEYTAAVARIAHRGRVVFERAYGTTRTDSLAREVYVDTLFDLASLTKLFVATLALRLVAEGKLALDEPLSAILPEWSGNERRMITLRMILAHTSGMNSGADYRAILDENVEVFALNSALVAAPGERVIYSDLGFIALGAIAQRVTGTSLAALVAQSFSPSPRFRPRAVLRPVIPATEDYGRRGRVQGFVHDAKAYFMGGMAGHAGLFGTAADVAALTECYLGTFHGRACETLPESLVREAVSEQAGDPVLRRGLGWALKTSDGNSCGRFMDRSSFGHTGFVGTCVWADPVRDVQGVLLTNSVYYGREDNRAFLAAFYEAMMREC